MGRFLRRLRYLLRRRQHEAELRDEMATHRSLRRAQLERGGAALPDAERGSRRALGNDLLAREVARGVWTPGWLERAWQDLAGGARILRTAPGLVLTAVALIALVIGGNATIYSVVHGVLTKGAPRVDAGGLFTLSWTNSQNQVGAESSYGRYEQLVDETRSFASLLASSYQRVAVGTDNGIVATRAGLVSQNYFDTLRLHLEHGRAPSIAESDPRAPGLVAVVSHRLWQEQLGASDDVLGRRVTINGQAATVIGVAPRDFHGAWLGEFFDVWLPFSSYPQIVRQEEGPTDGRRSAPVLIVGRLRSDVTRAQAQAELAVVDARLEPAEPHEARRVRLVPYSATAGGNSGIATHGGSFLLVFSVVTLLTLLIVSANVANLMLGRAVKRQREIAVRLSLGSSHLRVFRLLLSEGLVVAILAWGAALLLARVAADLIGAVMPLPPGAGAGFAEWFFRPDWTVAAYSMGLAAITTLVAVVGPILLAWRQPVIPWLKAGEHSVIRGRSRLSRALVILQLSLSVLLVAVAGLAWRSLSMLHGVDIGFRPDNILIARLSAAGLTNDDQVRTRFLDGVRERLQTLPGAVVVSYADGAPGENYWQRLPVRADAASEPTRAEINRVAPGFVAAHGLTVVAGRDLGRTVTPQNATALITQHLAETLWKGASPLGRRMLVGDGTRQVEVVGVVPNAYFSGFRPESRPNYVLMSAVDEPPSGELPFYVRFEGPLDRITSGIREALGPAGLSVPIVTLQTMDAQLWYVNGLFQMLASLLAAFGAGALVIATLGQYSVVLFDMRRRVREFGVRLALGASPQRLLASVMRDGARLSIIGLVIGGALSLAVGRLMGGFLYGVGATDATTYLSVAAVLAVTTMAACAIPARLASRVDPLRALREE